MSPSTRSGGPSACPEASTFFASAATAGFEQLPPIQPIHSPSALISAFAPGLAEVGFSARTTVASTNGSPAFFSRSAASRMSCTSLFQRGALLLQDLPHPGGRNRDLHVPHPKMPQSVDDRVHESGRRADGGRLPDALRSDGVVRRRRHRLPDFPFRGFRPPWEAGTP